LVYESNVSSLFRISLKDLEFARIELEFDKR